MRKIVGVYFLVKNTLLAEVPIQRKSGRKENWGGGGGRKEDVCGRCTRSPRRHIPTIPKPRRSKRNLCEGEYGIFILT